MLIAMGFALFAAALVQGTPATDPRTTVREATAAVEAGRVLAAREEWTARSSPDGSNRASRLALATLARLTYDYPTADRLYRRLFSTGAGEARRYSAYAHLGLANGLYDQGRLGEVDALLMQAREDARAAGDMAAEAEALAGLARLHAFSQGADVGIALVDSASRVAPPGARDVHAFTGCLRAQYRTVIGSPQAARELRAALSFARQAGEPRAEAVCLRALSLEYRFAGKPDTAVIVLRQLEALRRRIRDRSRVAEALFLQSDMLQDLAAYGEARDAMYRALAEARASHNLFVEASVKLSLASLYFRLNDNSTATDYVNQAMTEYEALADTGSVMMARSWKMQVDIASGELDAARRETDGVIDFFHKERDFSHESELYQTLADIATRQRDWSGADMALNHAEALLRGHGSTTSGVVLYAPRARVALYRGDLEAAERGFRRYLSTLDSTDRLPRYETRAHLAEIAARRGDLDAAERELRLAGAELDAWRDRLTDRELRELAFQASSSEANDRNSSIARVLALLAGGGHATTAFEVAEHRRARDLSDRMRQVLAFDTTGSERRDSMVSSTDADAATDLATLIPDDSTAILEYVTGAFGAPTTVFALQRPAHDRDPVRAAVLMPADSLTPRIARLVAFLESNQDPSALAREIGAAVLDPILGALGPEVTRLVIIPDGPLHRLPFDALRLPDDRYAVQRFAVSVAPSARVLAELWRRPRAPPEQGGVHMLALGDPAFARSVDPGLEPTERAAAETYEKAFAGAGGLPRLEGSAREVRQVARYVPSADVRVREAASAAYLTRADLTRVGILHLATHAVVDDRAVARTALALAPGNGESGFLGPSELAGLHLGADLVVLSACRTAGGVLVDGEGVQGLSAPLLQAGARSIVATEWRIADRGTLKLIDAFYDEMAKGLPDGQALQAAKLRMLQERRPVGEWSAFTLVGDPTVRLALKEPPSSIRYWAPGAVLLLAAFAFWARRRRVRY
jgi:CHAT domain-containing protein/tetratricopeptide (TPR) repeat protein